MLNNAPSLRNQLLKWLLLLLIPTLLAGVGFAYKASKHLANVAYDNALYRATLSLADQVEVNNGNLEVNLPKAALDVLEYDKDDFIYYQVSNSRGQIVIGEPTLTFPNKLPKAGQHYFYNRVLLGKEVRVAIFALPIVSNKASSIENVAIIQVAETLAKRGLMTEKIIAIMVIPQLLMIILVLGLLLYGIKRALLPLAALRHAISQRHHNDLSPLTTVETPQEVWPLLQAMNDLMLRVRASIDLEQQFIADASHQLRTPLAGLQTQAEMALREKDPLVVKGALAKIHESSMRLSHLVSQLLSLARLEHAVGDVIPFESTDLIALSIKVTEEWVPQALKHQIDLGFKTTLINAEPILIQGNVTMLGEMLANLLDNSIRHTPPNGEITVDISADDAYVTLTVTDTGSGIAESERELVFKRFYTTAQSLKTIVNTHIGAGLGLAIVQEVVQAHHAKILLDVGENGKGTCVKIIFNKIQ